VDYRGDPAEQILQNITMPEYATHGYQSCGDAPARLVALHTLEGIHKYQFLQKY
jgi:hypothetical protein